MHSRQSDDGRWQLVFLAGVAILLFAALGSGAAAGTAEADQPNVTVYSTADAHFEDGSEIDAVIENGTIEPAHDVVIGETLLVGIESERLATDLADRDGTPTERLFAVVDDGAELRLSQTNSGPNLAAKVARLGPANTTVYRSGETTFVGIDTGVVDLTYRGQDDSGTDPTFRGGDRFTVAFGYDGTEPVRGPEVVFRSVEATFLEHHSVLAPELLNTTVQVNVEPDEELTVRATFEDGTTMTETPGPVPWSEFAGVSLDFRDVPPETNYTLELVHDGDVVERQEGVVREPGATLRDAAVGLVETDEYLAELNVTAVLSHGGTVIVLDEFGAQVGSAQVPPGAETRLSIPLRNPDPGTAFEPGELRVQAVRQDDDIERRYPGVDAKLTLDVSEYSWESADWTRAPSGENTDAPARGESDSPDATDSEQGNYTVGDGAAESGGEFGGLAAGFRVAGVLGLLASAGFLLKRRFVT